MKLNFPLNESRGTRDCIVLWNIHLQGLPMASYLYFLACFFSMSECTHPTNPSNAIEFLCA